VGYCHLWRPPSYDEEKGQCKPEVIKKLIISFKNKVIALVTIVSLLIPLYAAIAKDTRTVEPVEVVAPEPVEVMIEVVKEEKKFVFDNDTLFAICTCESDIFGLGHPTQYEKDGVTVLTGRVDNRDTGMCQINKGYHLQTSIKLGYDLDTPQGNWDYAKHLFNTQGTQPWSASKACWSKKL
jgi:hypothetical protein